MGLGSAGTAFAADTTTGSGAAMGSEGTTAPKTTAPKTTQKKHKKHTRKKAHGAAGKAKTEAPAGAGTAAPATPEGGTSR